MLNTNSMMLVGVGGQGSLLASRIIGNVLLQAGYTVKLSEVHGMSQRGGSVTTYVRWGETVQSPIVTRGEADYIVSFEALEAARALPYLKEGGRLILNTQEILPMPVITGAMTYPEALPEKLAWLAKVTAVDALKLALEAGNAKAANVVLIGVLSRYMPFGVDSWLKALEETVPKKLIALNEKAFLLGRAAEGCP